MDNLNIFCVTDKPIKYLEDLDINLVGVGKGQFSQKYISCLTGKNIQKKEKHYSELTFHYWFWKNKLETFSNNHWIGFCQKRRFWLNSRYYKEDNDISNIILKSVPMEWEKYDAVLCEPVPLGTKLSKLLKRGWRNILDKPSLLFSHTKISVKIQFDMHHGYNVLNKAIDVMNDKDREEFRDYVNKNNFYNPHIMFISKKKILNKFFADQFDWLTKCEKIFGFDKLKNYDQTRLYAFLAERFVSFWFKKYSKSIEWPWIFFEKKEKE